MKTIASLIDEPVEQPRAWQPLSGPGLALFARDTLSRLLLVQLVVALAVGVLTAWSVRRNWFPVITEAIERLPQQGQVRSGRLEWRGPSPMLLAENRFLAISADLYHEGQTRSPAHIQVEFGIRDVKIFALLGFLQTGYPERQALAFNAPELKPWWGAWSPAVLALVVGSVAAALVLAWAVLASVYCWAAWLIGFFANRELTLAGSWRLAGASLLPGALFMSVALLLYTLSGLDVIQLLVATAAHFVVGWVYLVVGTLWVPRQTSQAAAKPNPFKD